MGLDVHKDSISVAVAEPGRSAGRLVGKVTHDVIAVDAQGHLTCPFNTEGMCRGHARVGEAVHTAIFLED